MADSEPQGQPETAADVNEALGEAIKAARDTCSMTQAALAERIGLSRASVANIERGEQTVTVPLLIRIANALAITPQTLLDEIAAADQTGADLGAVDQALSVNSLEADDRARRWIAAVVSGT